MIGVIKGDARSVDYGSHQPFGRAAEVVKPWRLDVAQHSKFSLFSGELLVSLVNSGCCFRGGYWVATKEV